MNDIKIKTVKSIVYNMPGGFFAESVSEIIKDFYPKAEEVDFDRYRPFSIEFSEMETTLSPSGTMLRGENKRVGKILYFGKLVSKDEVKKSHGEESNLYVNMKINDYEYVIQTVRGNFQPYDKDQVELLENYEQYSQWLSKVKTP